MMRSMFTGVSGLRIHQTKMDVIANNISNVNTVGYKSSRVTFAEVFSQTVSGASAPDNATGRGGTNPMQIGLGASVASIDKLMTQGAAQRTDKATDLMIDGEGFFIVGDESGQYFTRAGAMDIDYDGNLVNSMGLRVYGWDAVDDPNNPGQMSIAKGQVTPIKIAGEKEYLEPTTTKNIKFSGNLNAVECDNKTGQPKYTQMDFFDSLGNKYTVDVKMEYRTVDDTGKEIDPEWIYSVGDRAYVNGDRKNAVIFEAAGALGDKEIKITIGGKPATDDVTYQDFAKMEFGPNGHPLDPTKSSLIFTIDSAALTPPADFGSSLKDDTGAVVDNAIKLDFSTLRQFGNQTSDARADSLDGYAPGTLQQISIGSDGIITGRYSNNKTKILGQVPVATFANPAGLEKVGNNLFSASSNSGTFDGVGMEVGAAGGRILGGVLEMANVDLASEFTEMITTQRGFQANSRVISTSDDLLQELVNLKR